MFFGDFIVARNHNREPFMNSTPIVLRSLSDVGTKLVRAEAKGGSQDEAWLQELLHSHPELLPIEEFDDTFAPPIPIGREVQSGHGPIDNLFISPWGGLTIVETKLWKNPDRHRTVVAQVIDYAKELAEWNYNRLREAVLSASRNRGETEHLSLEDKVAATLRDNDVSLNQFQESVIDNLTTGNFLLLIVGDRISPNVALLTNAIQSAPGLEFSFGLVEMRLYSETPDCDWPLFVVPDVVTRTSETTRAVVKVRYSRDGEKPEVTVENEEAEEESEGRTARLPIDVEGFLREIPKDLVLPYREAIGKWQTETGGHLHFSSKMIFFRTELGGQMRKVVRSRKSEVTLVSRKIFDEWCPDAAIYEQYLNQLDKSPTVSSAARNGKLWVQYDGIRADDLRVLLDAAAFLAASIKKAEE